MPQPALWHLIPKVHLCQELEYQMLELGNPKHYWTYRDESFMGTVKAVCIKSAHPRRQLTTSCFN